VSEHCYRLTYHGDDHPDIINEHDAWLVLESSYRLAAVADMMLEKLAWGHRVHVRSGILEEIPAGLVM
jgi:hypothetical protein